jgi:NAD-dependent dihydropyrimidine dehydrogenase PreA subunit
MARKTGDWTRKELEDSIVSKMTAITLPVNISMRGKQTVLDMSELEKILRSAKLISQSNCECRTRVGNCTDPMDGCIGINDMATEMIEDCDAKQITADEALEAMRRTYDAGLVHMAYVFESKDEVEYICSCCSCCCHSLSAAIRFGYEDHVFGSRYVAEQDGDRCESCGICVDRCQFRARTLKDGELEFRQEECFGCGLCVETCPEEAISMVERGEGS